MIRQADNKLYQLLLAEHLGILIPKTAVPCDVVAITELVGRNPVVVKPLGKGVAIGADGARRVFYTTAIETDDLTDEILQTAPVMIQERISAERHLRVVTVGDEVWCSAMEAKGHALDWRESSRGACEWYPIVVPETVRRDALRIASAAHVRYTSQDWLEVNDERYFIDLNPCGKWLFLPEPIRDQVTTAIARWLVG
jgi:glutathione synthase/RimK-type ligase-like ATP-grasp enzyme